MNNKKMPRSITYIYVIWSLFLVVAVISTLLTTTLGECRYYEEKVEASNITKLCFDRIKKYKQDNEIAFAKEDINETGMLGKNFSYITTTTGVVESKRTSVNPNFAAVIIDMFKEAGVRKHDEVTLVFSGSFPAINIAVMAACDVFELKTCTMASIGSSSYGANDPNFTFFDMANLLYSEGLLKTKIDYISLGGSHDMGDDFWEGVSEPIIERIKASDSTYISIRDYKENLEYRMKEIEKKVPNMKLFINVGGNIVSMGLDEEAYIYNNGLIKPNYLSSYNDKGNLEKKGLIERYLEKGVPIVHMLNLKSLALRYDLPYDPVNLPTVGTGNVYYEKEYHMSIPIIAISVSVLLFIFLGINRYKERKKIMTNNVKPTIYFVEDDPSIYDLIEETLDVNGFNSQGFEEPLKMLQVISKQKPDLIILDLMLPHMSGYDVIETLQKKKEYSAIPIIIVSAKSAENDIVKGLDMGASDYITKPFGIREFVSRIKTNLRKVPKIDNSNVITIRDLSIDDDKHRCTYKGNVLELTLTEYSLLKQLMENAGRVQTRTRLLNIIWGYSHQAETRTLDMHVRSIREKLSHYTDESYIETIRGVGYMINE